MSAQSALTAREPATLVLEDFARRVAREMRIAASVADDCQDAIADDEQLSISPAMAVRIQGLDLLSQQLIELGRLFDRLASAGLPGEMSAGLLDGIVLSDLQRRLLGQADGVRVVDPELW